MRILDALSTQFTSNMAGGYCTLAYLDVFYDDATLY